MRSSSYSKFDSFEQHNYKGITTIPSNGAPSANVGGILISGNDVSPKNRNLAGYNSNLQSDSKVSK
jgi:hypothetical protein